MRTGNFAGRLGKDAELKYTPKGDAVCNFSIAVDAGYGDNKKTLWVNCAIWRERAEKLNQYLTKGKFVAVSGDVDIRAWINKNTGDAQCQLTINVDKLTLGPGGSDAAGDSEQRPQAARPQASAPINDDDIPF
jgi:single-strand DNA-binding protein